MPNLSDLRNRYAVDEPRFENDFDNEESLIVDTRSHLRPAQVVELRLGKALERGPTLSFDLVRTRSRMAKSQ